MTVRFLVGDVRDVLRTLDDESIDCCVTSPPYWGLRDYGTASWEGGDTACDHVVGEIRKGVNLAKSVVSTRGGGKKVAEIPQLLAKGTCPKCGAQRLDRQIGLEPTLGEHIDVMVDVMREIRRVLKPAGTLWLNYGDCYATTPNGRSAADTKAAGSDDRTFRDKPFSTVGPIYRHKRLGRGAGRWGGGNNFDPSLKPKDLCMVPNRLAIALQEDGWWVRSEIIWAKPNPMPESIKDRPATAHEKIFMLSKAPRYFYDALAVRRPAAEATEARLAQDIDAQAGSTRAHAGAKPNGVMKAVGGRRRADSFAREHKASGGEHGQKPQHRPDRDDTAYLRGEGRSLRNYEPAPVEVWNVATQPFTEAHFATFPPELAERCILAGCPVGGVVLDPFGGAGTTGLVADRLQRNAILVELNPEYVDIARRRISRDAPLLTEVA